MPLIVVLLSPPSRFFLPFWIREGMGLTANNVYKLHFEFSEKTLYGVVSGESHALRASQVWSPHFHWDRAMPSHSDQSRMEKSSLKTNKNPIYRYAPKADFEYPKRLWKFAKTTENGKKFLQVTYKVASTRLKNFQSYLM